MTIHGIARLRQITNLAALVVGVLLLMAAQSDGSVSIPEEGCWRFVYLIIPSDTNSLVESEDIHNIMFDLVDDMEAGLDVAWPILKNDRLYVAAGCDYMANFIEGLPKKYVIKETEMEVYKARYLEALN